MKVHPDGMPARFDAPLAPGTDFPAGRASSFRDWGIGAAIAIGYFLLAMLGLNWATVDGAASGFWPAAGVGFAGLLLGGLRLWPAIAVATFAAMRFHSPEHEWPVDLALALGNAAAAVVGAWLFRNAGADLALRQPRDILVFALSAVGVVAALGAGTGLLVLVLDGRVTAETMLATTVNWYLGDAIGILAFAPVLLVWAAHRRRPAAWWAHLATMLTVTAVTAGLVFIANADNHPISIYVLLPLIWAALSFGPVGAASALPIVVVLGMIGTSIGAGSFGRPGLAADSFLFLQQFLGVVSLTTLFLAAVADAQRGRERIERSEERFRSLVNASAQIVWLADARGRIPDESPSWRAFTGIGNARKGDGMLAAVHPEDREQVRAAWRACVAARRPCEHEFRLRRADGEYRWIESRAVPVFNADGTLREWVGACTDITGQKLAAFALRDADLRKDEFLAALAHELRNPLAPLRTGLQVLQRPGCDDTLRARMHAMMARQLGHMVRLVDDLLDVSRITRGSIELRRVRTGLQALVDAAIEAASSDIEARGHRLLRQMPDEPLLIDADPTRIVQVVANLLGNAAKYTPDGGDIAIRAEAQGEEVVLTVTDTGIGIPPEKLSSVFELFTQLDRSIDRAGGGLGVGLALARRLVRMHGGSLAAHSAGEGSGTSMEMRLPAAGPTAPTSPPGPTNTISASSQPASAAATAPVSATAPLPTQ
jgi:PAS domain S-box-containing protein